MTTLPRAITTAIRRTGRMTVTLHTILEPGSQARYLQIIHPIIVTAPKTVYVCSRPKYRWYTYRRRMLLRRRMASKLGSGQSRHSVRALHFAVRRVHVLLIVFMTRVRGGYPRLRVEQTVGRLGRGRLKVGPVHDRTGTAATFSLLLSLDRIAFEIGGHRVLEKILDKNITRHMRRARYAYLCTPESVAPRCAVSSRWN